MTSLQLYMLIAPVVVLLIAGAGTYWWTHH